MELIDKSALVAEIDKQIELLKPFLGACAGQIVAEANDKLSVLEELKNFLDTLEVKEVDLDGERRKYLTEHFNVYEDGILQSKRSNLPLDTYDVIKIAKHFYSLGLKAQKGEEV